MKTLSAFAVVAAIAFSAPAFGQQTIGANGAVLDGMGAGGNTANNYVFDGPPNADINSLTTSVPKLKGERGDRTALCALASPEHCRALLRNRAETYNPY